MARPASVRQFLEVSGISSSEVATFFLDRNNGRLAESINDFFSNPRVVQEVEKRTKKNSKKSMKSVSTELKELFNKYKEPQLDSTGKSYIGIDGTMRYLEDLGYEPEDEVVLCLADFLDSQKVGDFKEEQFLTNWNNVGCNTIEQMHNYIDINLRPKLLDDPEYFRAIYQYTFKFILEKNEKTLPLDMAQEYWHLLLPGEFSLELETFIKFLHDTSKTEITRDQWNMLLPFLQDYHNDPTLNGYDESQSWPLLMDKFYEYIKSDEH
ncbi:hypothetical protein FOA43_003658 [Brettanomyces nanus]|uniref:Defective in cullin neddylation protein n=1 Tax=Eeniella nana TaxID=13502 RepID=A0A875S8R3_EENNA|nr:uncharacterized protein FOA43_003658 [Brettanomyces nanus]QPG76272.1 hypothetical protein FOA43_003658 [Brettanomyces nanus]